MRKLGRRRMTRVLSLLVSLGTFATVVSIGSVALPRAPPPGPAESTGPAEWPMFHATADHRGWTDSLGPVSNQLAWTYDVNSVNASEYVRYFAASPMILGGHVFAAAHGTTMIPEDTIVRVVALDEYDGAP